MGQNAEKYILANSNAWLMHFKHAFLLCIPSYCGGIQVVSHKHADSLTDFNYLAQQDSL